MKIRDLFAVLLCLVGVTSSDTHQLTANEVFFSPTGKLRTEVNDTLVGEAHNRYDYMDYVRKWYRTGDTLVWGLKLQGAGVITVNPIMSVGANQDGSEIEILIGDESKKLIVHATDSLQDFVKQGALSFTLPDSNLAVLKIRISSLTDVGNEIGYLQGVEITDPSNGIKEVWKRRWRPFAVHASSFYNRSRPDSIIIQVHENRVTTPNAYCYMPITTAYGYSGTSWYASDQSFHGFNFSLWSFAKDEEPTPYEEWSHLIAVGPGLEFGRFDHEGTGVKPRGDGPFDNNTGITSQVFATRIKPGVPYNTYWTYYLNQTTQKWHIFACGRKYNSAGTIKYPLNGAFIEVPGATNDERSGHQLREVQYRGWMMDEAGIWYAMDQLNSKSHDGALSFENWGVTDDGERFFMQMGGFSDEAVSLTTEELTLPNPTPLPAYMQGDNLNDLFVLPAEFDTVEVTAVNSNNAQINIKIFDVGTNAQSYICWGTIEGLTDSLYWENQKKIILSNGNNSIDLDALLPETKYFFRAWIVNDEGITWMMDTDSFETTDGVASIAVASKSPKAGFIIHTGYTNIPFYISAGDAAKLQLFDLQGRVVWSTPLSGSAGVTRVVSLEKQGLASGVYLLQLHTKTAALTHKISLK